ncbi:MAG: VOC family protein [Polyangiales bacterium]
MKPTPKGWPRISVAVFYDDAAKAIDWLVKAFGFEVRLKVEGEGGAIEHSELTYGDGMVMVSQAGKRPHYRSPRTAGGNTQSMMIYVDDVEAHCARAREAGAKIIEEPKVHDYGEEYWTDRGYECEDHEGHHWWFYERLKSGSKS